MNFDRSFFFFFFLNLLELSNIVHNYSNGNFIGCLKPTYVGNLITQKYATQETFEGVKSIT